MDETNPPAAPAPAPAVAAESAASSLLTGAPDQTAAAAAPPVYEIQAPDGLDESIVSGVKDFFAQHNVPAQLAQPLFDKYFEGMRDLGAANAAAWNDLQAQWRTEVATDKEIGGDKTQGVIASIRKGAETLLGAKGAAAFYGALDMTGAGNHPEVIRALNRAFSIHAPPSHVAGRPAGSDAKPTLGRQMYPSMDRLGNDIS